MRVVFSRAVETSRHCRLDPKFLIRQVVRKTMPILAQASFMHDGVFEAQSMQEQRQTMPRSVQKLAGMHFVTGSAWKAYRDEQGVR